MIKNIIFKDRDFKTKKDLFHALKDNEETIIGRKKSYVYKSIEKGQSVANFSVIGKQNVNKETFEEGFIYAAINSTQWLDSHQDVHMKGCYKRTVKDQQGRVYYIDTHKSGLSNIIAKKKDIEMFYDDVSWGLLGKNIEGTTEALMFKIKEENIKAEYLTLIKEDRELQNSLAMTYKNIVLAVDSKDPEFKENKEIFDEYIETIANKDKAIEDGHFFAVKELAIQGEGSLCPVVGGSNTATSVFQLQDIQPGKSVESQKEASERSRQEELRKYYLNKI